MNSSTSTISTVDIIEQNRINKEAQAVTDLIEKLPELYAMLREEDYPALERDEVAVIRVSTSSMTTSTNRPNYLHYLAGYLPTRYRKTATWRVAYVSSSSTKGKSFSVYLGVDDGLPYVVASYRGLSRRILSEKMIRELSTSAVSSLLSDINRKIEHITTMREIEARRVAQKAADAEREAERIQREAKWEEERAQREQEQAKFEEDLRRVREEALESAARLNNTADAPDET